jgi:hypothetical protein
MRAFLNIVTILLLGSFIGCKRPPKLEDAFSDLSIGVPAYESVETFDHPADAVKGDYFSLDFTQSSNQFNDFISKLGVTETNVLSPGGVPHVTVASKTSPKCPWFLALKARPLEGPEHRYRVHLEGRQPYD